MVVATNKKSKETEKDMEALGDILEVTRTGDSIEVEAVDTEAKKTKAERVRESILGKFKDDEYKLALFLSDNYDIVLWPGTDKPDLTWIQQVGENFVIIGKTEKAKMEKDVGDFYSAVAEIEDGKLMLNRFVVEATVENTVGTSFVFECCASVLKDEVSNKADKWEELGYGVASDLFIKQVKIIDTIPF